MKVGRRKGKHTTSLIAGFPCPPRCHGSDKAFAILGGKMYNSVHFGL